MNKQANGLYYEDGSEVDGIAFERAYDNMYWRFEGSAKVEHEDVLAALEAEVAEPFRLADAGVVAGDRLLLRRQGLPEHLQRPGGVRHRPRRPHSDG